MATIKSFTDLEQSRKLADILPLESADMKWLFWKEEIDAPKLPTFEYSKSAAESYKNTEAVYLPCWSLAALLDILPDRTCVYKKTYKDGRVKYKGVAEGIKELILKGNPIDACVTMIEKLHELSLL